MALATELHGFLGSPRARQVLAVVTALSMLYHVMDHISDPIEAAKWSNQMAVNYVQLSEADAPSRLWKVKPKLHMMQELFDNV